jgi:alanyl-tRNA synthetase
MTSSQIRQSFLDFFKSQQHTIVPSSSLMPDSPNLLFTNAGMNQFVPIFLGQTKCPYTPGRAADTQKCIRAGGKHNDLDDVGLDTYHHTFFEMLGNWSFGDYFKKEAIQWAWELVINIWKFPPQRLYATVYSPDKSKNDPSEFDQEAWDYWAEKFRSVGLDPAVHIVNGNKKDNFWMMGDTGPCGPCSELHVDLTPAGDTKGALVNKGSPKCIEIWNLVFIQFNANPDGTFSPLPAKHVDTGMGFERVTSIIQGTKGLTDFANAKISNYETDIFRPIFDALEKLSGKKYGSTLPQPRSAGDSEEEKSDIAFRVIADHIRTLSFAIADGIQPGNNDRNYVLRRILRRAVRYGRTLGFREPFFYKLVDVLADTMGDVFPEIRARKKHVQEVIQREEEAFNKTLDSGLLIFDQLVTLHDRFNKLRGIVTPAADRLAKLLSPTDAKKTPFNTFGSEVVAIVNAVNSCGIQVWQKVASQPEGLLIANSQKLPAQLQDWYNYDDHTGKDLHKHAMLDSVFMIQNATHFLNKPTDVFWGSSAFLLYDTYGFPLDLTELMARERGLTVDTAGFEKLMEEQRARARAAQKKEVISLSQIETTTPTRFVGYESPATETKVLEVVQFKDKIAVVLESTSLYAEMGGQVGDTGTLSAGSYTGPVINTLKNGNTFLHILGQDGQPEVGSYTVISYDRERRWAIQRHHTVTHLLHWALHEVVSREASQKGSFVGPEKLTFDFNSPALTPEQVADVEKLVNERILENAGVSWTEVPHAEVKNRKDVMQFFGDKYGDTVRVVQIGGHAQKLDGYSMELCGGTHTRATGEIGLFRITGENAVAAGVRRIEAVAGLTAYDVMKLDRELIKSVAGKINSPIHELEKKIEALIAHQKELERQLRSAQQREASNAASNLLEHVQTINGIPAIIHNIGGMDGDFLQAIADSLKGRFHGVVVLGGAANGAVALVASVSPEFTSKIQAGKIIQAIAPIVGGKGGGKPDNARGGGKDAGKLDEALAKAKTLMG